MAYYGGAIHDMIVSAGDPWIQGMQDRREREREEAMRQELASAIGPDGQIDYGVLSQKLLGGGDVRSAIAASGMQDKRRERQSEQQRRQRMMDTLGFGSNPPKSRGDYDGRMGAYKNAISGIESAGSGDYAAIGPTHPELGRALGKYQVMEANVGPWTQEVFGQPMTPEQFLANPQAQDAVFESKFGQYVQQYGADGAAQAWFAGPGGVGQLDREDSLGMSVGEYTQAFNRNMGGQTDPGQAFPRGEDGQRTMREFVASLPGPVQDQLKALAVDDPMEALKVAGELYQTQQAQMMERRGDRRERRQERRDARREPPETRTIYDEQTGRKAIEEWDPRTRTWNRVGGVASGADTEVNINMDQESKYAEEVGKGFAAKNMEIIDGAQQARGKIATLDSLKALLPQAYTGAGAEILVDLKRWGKTLGIDTGDLGPAEAARAISNQLALMMRSPSGGAGMPGAMSDKDREFLVKAVPGLSKTPEGNAIMIDYMKRIEQRNIDVDNLRRQYVAQNGQLDDGFYDALSTWSERNPIFSPMENAKIDLKQKLLENDSSGWVEIGGRRVRRVR